MDDPVFNQLLRRYRHQGVPVVPSNLSQKVWREIRVRQSHSKNTFFSWLMSHLPRLLAPSLAMAFIVSMGMTLVMESSPPTQNSQKALGLKVFSEQSMPLTRSAQNP